MKSTRHAVLIFTLAVLGIGVAMPASADERMLGSEIATVFRGSTLQGVYNDGATTSYTETYDPDGTVRYHDEENGDQTGVWAVNNNTFCTFYETIPGSCFEVTTDGANCFTFTAVDIADRPPPPNDWTARGWNSSAPSTCPK